MDGDGRLSVEFHATDHQLTPQMVQNGHIGAHIAINVMLSQQTCKRDLDELAANFQMRMANHIGSQTNRTP